MNTAMNSINVVYWNGAGYYVSEPSIRRLLSMDNAPHILCLAESKLAPDHPEINAPNYQTISIPFKLRSSGLLLFVHKTIPFKTVPSASSKPGDNASMTLTITVSWRDQSERSPQKAQNICFAYVTPDASAEDWHTVSDHIRAACNTHDTTVIGDLNARHP